MTADTTIRIEPATTQDVPRILWFIRELADYEKMSDQVVATEDLLRRHLFGPAPKAEVVFAWEDGQAEPSGFALFFHHFSTFQGRPGIYLEDVFVRPARRGRGVGKALLRHLARLAVQRGCARLEWWVLDWNEPAIGFYKRLGAVPMDDWTVYRVSGPALARLAEKSDGDGD